MKRSLHLKKIVKSKAKHVCKVEKDCLTKQRTKGGKCHRNQRKRKFQQD